LVQHNSFKISTYIRLVSVDSKPLTEMLNPLDATLTKNRGVGVRGVPPC
jgi:hypothetical protein